jgi:hypothetical protein
MSSTLAANVTLQFDKAQIGEGANPTAAATSGTPFTIAAVADVLTHTVDSDDSASLSFAVTAGQIIYCRLTRLGANVLDTHTGDMRLIEVRVQG